MSTPNKPIEKILEDLQERAKELNCLYKIEELLSNPNASLDEIFEGIILAIPPGWQYPDICHARITYQEKTYQSPNFKETTWVQVADTIVEGNTVARIEVYYTEKMPHADEGPFLKEERKLIDTISERLGHFIMHQRLIHSYQEWQTAKEELLKKSKAEWWVILDMLQRTDQNLYLRIARKMLNYLCWSGIKEAARLLQRMSFAQQGNVTDMLIDQNRPLQRENLQIFRKFHNETFKIAADYLGGEEILSCIQKWMRDDKSSFLFNVLENLDSSLEDIADAIGRYLHIASEGITFSPNTEMGLRVSLIRRFLTDHLEYINISKKYIEINDFAELLPHIIFPHRTHGKLGGKSAGLILASQIIKKEGKNYGILQNIKIPKSWYITSDSLLKFIHYNNLEDVINQKYKEIDLVRQEYPHIVQIFKNSYFSPDILKSLSMALDDFGDKPLIVRSSSLLEDRIGASFFGKYKSLFLANQGTKKERLTILMDAIAEVYSSVFSPDPLEYRTERGLLDFNEEMGIMIQEVIGTKVGNFYFPAYAGIAFSNNDHRWSPRIKREDGLLRIVPGLGTRAVDRVSDDYPVLVAPGQPGLKVNVTIDEMMRYSPRKMDVINLATNTFETIDIQELLRTYRDKFPAVDQIFSINRDGLMQQAPIWGFDYDTKDMIVTFDGLINSTQFTSQVLLMIKLLQEKIGTPVDIEFVSDGTDFYLLQCRPQSYSLESLPSPIPRDIPKNKIVFTANRYISNGKLPEITHIVYVDPENYSRLSDIVDLNAVGRTVSKLNKLLPKRQFILMGPGRWGSRGDIKLGVNVTYSDINNTAALIEIARKKGNYLPDLSFGTHFFQDLVEASIRYIPLYPDDQGIIFNERFLRDSHNVLEDILPEYQYLAEVIHVVDIPAITSGMILCILMNAEIEEAIGYLTSPSKSYDVDVEPPVHKESQPDEHWRWRLSMAETIAAQLGPDQFNVKACYLFGSTKNATAGPGSDIDVLIHFQGSEAQRKELELWLNGWSQCLGEINYLKTGYKSEGLLDYHIITDDDIAQKTSYAVKIGAVTDAARPLALSRRLK